MSAKQLALEFRYQIQRNPALIGMWIHNNWIRKRYPAFCRALGVSRRPPYKDFANHLATLMLRKRISSNEDGKRSYDTRYLVQDPDAGVVSLVQAKKLQA